MTIAKKNKRVFVSYSRKNSNFVYPLVDDLNEQGVTTWIDKKNIRPGKRWDREIQNALETCECFLGILSPDSVLSDNVLDEIYYALDKGKEITLILYKQCDIPFRIRRLHYISFQENYPSSLSLLLSDLKEKGAIQQRDLSNALDHASTFRDSSESTTLGEIDFSGKVDSFNEATVIVLSGRGTYSILVPEKVKKAVWAELLLKYPNKDEIKRKVIFITLLLFLLLGGKAENIDHIVIDDEYKGYGSLLKGHLLNLFRTKGIDVSSQNISVRKIENSSLSKQLGRRILRRKATPDKVVYKKDILSLMRK